MQARSKPVTFFPRRAIGAAVVLAVLAAVTAHADSYTWDPDQTPTTGSDDNGTWSAGGYGPYYWSNGTSDVAWSSSSSGTDTAVFGVGGAGSYTVGVQQTIGVGGITFNSGNYTINNNYNGALNLNGAAVPIVVNNGATPAISVQLTGTGGLSVSGGLLTLGDSGSSTQSNFTGSVAVSNGTISVVGYQYGGPNPGQSPLGDTATAGQTVTINNGGVLQFGNQANNIIGGPFPALAVTTIINSGGSVIGAPAYDTYGDGRGNTLGNLVLNGGTLTTGTGSFGDVQQSFYLSGGSLNVTAPSVINTNGSAHNGINLATTTTFNVGATGGNPDLSVGVSLWDPPSAAGGGSATLVKTGPGYMQLNAASSYSGGTTVSAGTLQINNAAALGNSSGPLTANGGVLDLNGDSPSVGPLSGAAGTVLTSSGGATLTTNIPLGTSTTFGGTLSDGQGQLSLTVGGSGKLTLAGNNTYTGPTNIGGGTLYLTGSAAGTTIAVASGAALGGWGSAPAASVSVNDGGILDFTPNNTAGTSLTLSSLTFNGGATINLSDSGGQYNSLPAVNVGALTTASTIKVNVTNLPMGSGTVEIAQYSGPIGGSGFGAFSLASPVNSGTANYSLVNVGGYIDLTYSTNSPTAGALYWTGAGDGNWNVTSAHDWATANGSPTTYQEGSAVLFDNRGSAGTTVNVNAANVNPASVTFSNSGAVSYTLTGSNGIAGSASVTVNGGGLVTFQNNNSYTGPTTITAGTLAIGGAGVLGGGNYAGAISNAGLLNYASSANQTFSGPISGGGTLAQSGPGLLSFAAVGSTYTGPTIISGGVLQLGTYNYTGVPGPPIGVKFYTSNQVTGSAGAPGAVMSGWNNLPQSSNGGASLTNSSGAASGASISWTLGSFPGVRSAFYSPPSSQDGLLLDDYLSYYSSSEVLTVTGIPYSSYSLYAYYTNSSGATNDLDYATVGGTTYYFSPYANNNGSLLGYTQISNTSSSSSPGGNYAVFSGLSGSTATLSAFSASQNAGLAAIEIVPNSTTISSVVTLPSTTPLEIGGGTFDLNGGSQQVASLSDYAGGGGSIINSNASATAILTLSPTGTTTTYSGTILSGGTNGAIALALNGNGTQVLAGANTYSGGTTLSAGTLNFGNTAALGSGAVTFAGNATLQAGVGGTLANNLAINSNCTGTLDTQANVVTLSGAITGSGALAKVGNGVLALSSSNGYSGGTTLSAGTLSFGNVAALGSGAVTFAGNATLQAGTSGTLANNLAIGSGYTGTLDTQTNAVTLSGVITGGGGLTKAGPGVLTLSATTSNYAGPTTISDGVLQLGSITIVNPPSSTIGVKFYTSNQVTGSAGAPGAVMSGWNNVNNNSGTPLTYSSGAASGASISWTLGSFPGIRSAFYSPPSSQNGLLLDDYLAYYSSSEVLTVTGIPYSSYSLYAYYTNSNGATNDADNATVGGTTYYFSPYANNNGTLLGYTQISNTSSSSSPSGNYAVFSGLSGSTATLSAFSASQNAGLAAIEIVPAGSTTTSVATLPSTTALQMGSGVFDLNGGSQQVASLSDYAGGGGSIINSNTSATAILTLSPTGTTTTYSGTILSGGTNGAIALVLNGDGTQVLAGANTYSGGTWVEAGTLIVDDAGALPAGSSLTVGADGTFIFDPTAAASPMAGGEVATTPPGVGSAGAVAAVPEPGTMALLLAGLAAATCLWRRRT